MALLGDLVAGATVKIPENGVSASFRIGKHNYEGSGRTLLVRSTDHSKCVWPIAIYNAYLGSNVDLLANGSYLTTLPVDIQNQITDVLIPYTPGKGDYTLNFVYRRGFILSATEAGVGYPAYSDYVVPGLCNDEGAPVNCAGYCNSSPGSVTWTRSPASSASVGVVWYDEEYKYGATLRGGAYSVNGYSQYAFRPAFTLPPEITVDSSNNVVLSKSYIPCSERPI